MHDVYMTKEEQALLEAEQAEAKAKAEASAQDDDPADAEAKALAEEESKQHKAELLKEQAAREKAEKAAADLAFKLREKKRTKDETLDEQPDEDEDKPLTRKEFQAALAKEREATRKELLNDEASRFASEMATSDLEKQVILEKWRNRSFPADLTLKEQIEECYLATNKKKILGENNELKRALRGKSGVNTDASATQHDAPIGNQPKLVGPDASEYARVGFKWNASSKRYEKKLANGSLLVKDPKTKQTQLVKA